LIINKVKIAGFGKFINKEVSFNKGLNIVFGKNESGKSTLQNFIKASLYGFEKNKRTDGEGRPPEKTKYKPWNTNDYGGYLELETDSGETIRIERDFDKNEARVFDENLVDITNRFDYTSGSGSKIGEGLLGLDRISFESSAFVGQGSSPVVSESRNHLFEKIVNLINTGREDESAAKAVSAISDAKRNLGNPRTNNRPYNRVKDQINRLENEVAAAKESNIEMAANVKRKRIIEDRLKVLLKELTAAEAGEKSEKLLSEKSQLDKTAKRYTAMISEIEQIDNELYNDRIKLSSVDPGDVRESDILSNLRLCATANEKYNRLPEGNHEEKLRNQIKKSKTSRIWLYTVIALIAASVPLGIFISPFAFIATGIGFLALLAIMYSKHSLSVEQLQEYVTISRECSEVLSSINNFLVESGFESAGDLPEAEKNLNALLGNIREASSLSGLIRNKEARKSGQEALAAEIIGRFQNLSELESEIKKLDEALETASDFSTSNVKSSSDLRDERRILREELAGINRLLDEYLHDENELALLEEELQKNIDLFEQIEKEKMALDRAEQLIKDASKSLKGNIFPLLNEKMGKIISKITDGRHNRLLAGLGKAMNTDFEDNARSIWNFSDGTIEQMYLSLRLAASDIISENEGIPLLIDEAFAFYDEDRMASSLELLHKISQKKQVILFTCRESELRVTDTLEKTNVIEL